MERLTQLLEKNVLPDRLVRRGIRMLLQQRLQEEEVLHRDPGYKWKFLEDLRSRDIAEQAPAANEQHYEVPTEFYLEVLGPNLKYSSCLFANDRTSLEDAEEEMLLRTVQRCKLEDGMDVLDLGCGWGSVTLYIAKHYPKCRITSLSNSWTQKKFIDGVCEAKGYRNVTVETGDVTKWTSRSRFDRVFSVEMFEHMKNYEKLMEKISTWLKPKGLLFVHHFCHREFIYHFESEGAGNWMGKYFFTGGTMPSDDTLVSFQRDLVHVNTWKVNGNHYSRTLEYWLQKMDARIERVRSILHSTYGEDNAVRFEAYWRTFFMACSELFRFRDGWEWYVVHHLFQKR
eukprot:Plantae.Rhodophyta-Purpureofilum_apyrenoidigerum.ctg1023.p1 GENE.Plantae.Rhodophyta-Purpureofilum_apyrenoidigerum.ctg1023~~Plantae.Rhodophyta-Purpureofilum_apyrenoidigerum.ctg1023.p1  ORF type:complete len:342 (-),score=62.59 Plantae.Rhodophyta-Purpureofilum_apyrenoidigerum.ctg1023:336-1361(-)